MSVDVGGLPLFEIRFDEQGDVDAAAEADLASQLDALNVTDVLVFSHGWNNSQDTATSLYKAFFGQLAPLAQSHGAAGHTLALLGVYWPSQRWSDEPIPDFSPPAAGAAAAVHRVRTSFDPPPPPDAHTAAAVRSAFPASERARVDELLRLLKTRPHSQKSLDRARELIGELARTAGHADDGELHGVTPALAKADPNGELFDAFAGALEQVGVVTGGDGAAAGLGDSLQKLWAGATEAARQLTYWQMKSRAGTVGEQGLGPMLGRLLGPRPALGVHLIGHSFGARVVSYALKGLPDSINGGPPIKGVTLLQGAFSHWAFAPKLSFDPHRSGALYGQQRKVAGSVIACYSSHDMAVGTFYPLASKLSQEDAAAFEDDQVRWGGLGHDGHRADATERPLIGDYTPYDFSGDTLTNIDASSIVSAGGPPSGAHSDIVHPELAWVVLCNGGLV